VWEERVRFLRREAQWKGPQQKKKKRTREKKNGRQVFNRLCSWNGNVPNLCSLRAEWRIEVSAVLAGSEKIAHGGSRLLHMFCVVISLR